MAPVRILEGVQVMKFRKIIFWIHLVTGLIAGLVIGLMSFTGVAIAFEEEMLQWIDRHVSVVAIPAEGASPRTVAALEASIREQRPDFALSRLVVQRDPRLAYEAWAGRSGPLYVNPYTGQVQDSRAHATHDFLHWLEELHRWLAMRDDQRVIGRMINGVCNLAFLGLCLTGLYLWFPGVWTWRNVKMRLWFKRAGNSKARDFNWHHVFGWWSLPVLLVLVVTAVVISFEWAHKLVFLIAGETPPVHRDFRMTFVPPVEVPDRGGRGERASFETILASAQREIPEWQSMGLNLTSPEQAPGADASAKLAPVSIAVTVSDYMPNRAYIPVELDPRDGQVLRAIRLKDRSPGLQARIWIRFLHTGAAFGVPGKMIATLATLASLVLVYTGFALSYRRFFRRRGKSPSRIDQSPEPERLVANEG